MARKLTHDEFVVKARAVHGDRFTYGPYLGSRAKIKIHCPEHGEFEQVANSHVRGAGCPSCSNETLSKNFSLSTEQFIARSKTVHGDRFDYSKAVYTGSLSPVVLVDENGFEFTQRAGHHMRGRLPLHLSGRALKTTAEFIAQAEEVHGGFYTYDKAEYVNAFTKVVATCYIHGDFDIEAKAHLAGKGCKECADGRNSIKLIKPQSTFIAQAEAVHGDRFDYSKVNYENGSAQVEIVCEAHGTFLQRPDYHLSGKGCQKCGGSVSLASSNLLDAVDAMGIEVAREARPFDDRRQSVDALVNGIALEYQGLFWHSTGSPSITSSALARVKHFDKRKMCEAAGIRYVAIYEDEWLNEPEKVLAYLRNLVGKAPVVYARKLNLRQLSIGEAREFYNKYHFMGAPTALHNTWGLVDFLDQIVGAMTITPAKEVRGVSAPTEWSLSRMVFDGTRVVGGASRLFKACRKACPDAEIISYVDLDKFTGGVYEALGFVTEHDIAPDYWTIWRGDPNWKGYRRRHKTATKRSNLAKLAGFDPDESEFENCQRMKLFRIYHSGRLKMRFSPKPQ